MKKRILILFFVSLIIGAIIGCAVYIPVYKDYQARKKEEERIANAKIVVELAEDLELSFMENKKVSDLITYINGDIIDDYEIDTSELGSKTVKFKYINEEGITIPYKILINVVDDVPPSIWLGETYSVETGFNENLVEKITCADNLDDNPVCEIIGDYNTSKAGSYPLQYKATDNAGNVNIVDFTLKVVDPQPGGSTQSKDRGINPIADIIRDYKTENTKIGIDVSSWQGDINFQAVKDSGVEFVIIRVGSTLGVDGEYFVDKKFIQNIQGFNEVGLPVGVYFYTYSYSQEKSIEEAKWVLEQINGYDVPLGVAYDWESWSFYNEFHQSFYSTTLNAKAFLDTVSEAGYKGLLYSSKNYLEKVWYPIKGYDVWLAHYTDKTTYEGEYKYWQLCSNGKVPGINGYVDVNIMYEQEEV